MGKRLGRFITHYRDEFFLPDKRSGMQVFTYKLKEGAEKEIYRRISDITISMKSCVKRMSEANPERASAAKQDARETFARAKRSAKGDDCRCQSA